MSSAITESVRQAGIVGAGGAGFPTHVKLAARAATVIANGAECEPLLHVDKAVLHERAVDVLAGLRLLAEATGAGRAVLALKAHYRDLVAQIREAAAAHFPEAEVVELGNFYPAGDEQVLVNLVTGRVVPEGGIPLQVNAVVNNVVTLSQVARAVHEGRAVTRRPLTIAGEVQQPLTCELPIGTSFRHAVECAGGPRLSSPWVVLEGGPMMGRVVADPDEPITKRTSGVLVLAADHPVVQRRLRTAEREALLARAACCQCRLCTDLCPRANLGHSLRPHLAMRALGSSPQPTAHLTTSFLCSLCGVCETYACPMGLSPRKVFERLRSHFLAAGLANPHRETVLRPNEFLAARRVPLPRLLARLGLAEHARVRPRVDWRPLRPPAVRILLAQHTGVPAQPVVSAGQRVREGELIAEIPEGKLGARLHASIDGHVVKVDSHEIRIACD